MHFKGSIKEALPPGSPRRAPIARGALFPEPSFTCLSKSPVKKLAHQVPLEEPFMEGNAPFQSLLLYICILAENKSLVLGPYISQPQSPILS
jgi:hypothetical protein